MLVMGAAGEGIVTLQETILHPQQAAPPMSGQTARPEAAITIVLLLLAVAVFLGQPRPGHAWCGMTTPHLLRPLPHPHQIRDVPPTDHALIMAPVEAPVRQTVVAGTTAAILVVGGQ